MPACPRMFHVARRVCEECGGARSPCGMCWGWCLCVFLDLLLLAQLYDGCMVCVGVVVSVWFCCWSMVGVMGESMWEHCCVMMLLAVYMRMWLVLDMPC